jgi:aspartate/methionine/tyrosine aminotransferase
MEEYAAYQARGLALNMARGKPSPEQLELSMGLFDVLSAALSVGGGTVVSAAEAAEAAAPAATGAAATATAPAAASAPAAPAAATAAAVLHAGEPDDYRNYGGLTGIPEARALMAAIMGLPPELVNVLGNASLQIMYDTVARAMTHGVLGSEPWVALQARGETPAFLTPVPGYDRHFALTEHFGIRMIPVPLLPDGPDLNVVEPLVASDATIKGIWCVPRFANPTGAVYSTQTVQRLAAMPVAAADFRIYWDNAYAVHDLYAVEEAAPPAVTTAPPAAAAPLAATAPLPDLRAACEQAGNPDRWYQFASTSKITFPGAGIAAFASSAANLESIKNQLAFQTIGPDKLNQLRHVLFLRDLEGVRAHMRRHAAIVAPKFNCVLRVLDARLGGLGIGEWTRPGGGYFISFTGLPGTAKRVVALAKGAGVVLTAAGATWPYGKDPADSNIRIAPTYPSIEELEVACELFALCVKIASLEVLEASAERI